MDLGKLKDIEYVKCVNLLAEVKKLSSAIKCLRL